MTEEDSDFWKDLLDETNGIGRRRARASQSHASPALILFRVRTISSLGRPGLPITLQASKGKCVLALGRGGSWGRRILLHGGLGLTSM